MEAVKVADKGYWYLRLKQDFFKSEEMMVLQSMRDGCLYSDILLKMYLASLGDGGRLLFHGSIPYTPEMLATVTGHSVGVVEKAVKVLQQIGLVEILENGTIYMADIQNYIGKSSSEADRKREYRQRIAEERSQGVAAPAVQPVAEVCDAGEKEQEAKEKPPSKKTYTKEFEELWEAYPRKKEKAGGYAKYKARLGDGYSHEELMSATREYAAECKRNRTEEKYIKLCKTFFGASTPFLDYIKECGDRGHVDESDDGVNPFRKSEG